MEVSPAIGKMITVLKQELKARGLRYSDVASRLGLSEITVKRYLTGKGVDLSALEKLAEVVDLDLLQLVSLAQQQSSTAPRLSKSQQAALGRNRILAGVYIHLLRGGSPAQIAEEFEIAPDRMEALLTKLVDFGLIRRLSNQNVKILAIPDYDKKGGDLYADFTVGEARRFLSEINFRDSKCIWRYNVVRLSLRSMNRVDELMKRFHADVLAMSKSDLSAARDETQWCRVFIGVEPTSRKKLSPFLAK